MSKNYAPVLIMTLNRFEHFRHCIESLSKCIGAKETELYIALDYPFDNTHWEGYEKNKEFIATIKEFKKIHLLNRSINLGAEQNFFDSLEVVFEKFDRVIITEDDNLFSYDFLEFINKGLDFYETSDKIFSISGYQYPISIPANYNNDIYIWTGFSAWGVGIWKNKWQKIDWNKNSALIKVRKFLKNYYGVFKLNQIANHYLPGLIRMIECNKLNGDTYICMYQYINKMYSIFPVISRTRNMGHDGSGVNGGFLKNDIYSKQEIYSGSGLYCFPYNIKPNIEVNSMLNSHWKRSFKSQLKIAAKLFLLNFGLYKSLK